MLVGSFSICGIIIWRRRCIWIETGLYRTCLETWLARSWLVVGVNRLVVWLSWHIITSLCLVWICTWVNRLIWLLGIVCRVDCGSSCRSRVIMMVFYVIISYGAMIGVMRSLRSASKTAKATQESTATETEDRKTDNHSNLGDGALCLSAANLIYCAAVFTH